MGCRHTSTKRNRKLKTPKSQAVQGCFRNKKSVLVYTFLFEVMFIFGSGYFQINLYDKCMIKVCILNGPFPEPYCTASLGGSRQGRAGVRPPFETQFEDKPSHAHPNKAPILYPTLFFLHIILAITLESISLTDASSSRQNSKTRPACTDVVNTCLGG